MAGGAVLCLLVALGPQAALAEEALWPAGTALAADSSSLADLGRLVARRTQLMAELPTLPAGMARARKQVELAEILVTLTQVGDRSHIADALAAYEAALVVVTPDNAREAWADTMLAYGRFRWIVADGNADPGFAARGVGVFQEILRAIDKGQDPKRWGDAQYGLGLALADLATQENSIDRRREAIAALQAALTVRSRWFSPGDWMVIQASLGDELMQLFNETQAIPDMEAALAARKAVLTVADPATSRDYWADAQYRLGMSSWMLGSKRRDAATLRQAVEAYRQALTVYDLADPHSHRLDCKGDLGLAMLSLDEVAPDRAVLEAARENFEELLRAESRERRPRDWSMTNNLLGQVLTRLAAGEEGTALLERAVALHRAGLGVGADDLPAPSRADARYQLGVTLHQLGRRKNDAKLLGEARSLIAETLPGFQASQWEERVAEASRALAEVEAALAALPRQPQARGGGA